MKSNNANFCMLLTSCIDVGKMPDVRRIDLDIRLGDYRAALLFYLNQTSISKIVYCDNSGYDLSVLKSLIKDYPSKEVEFLSFTGQNESLRYGKGHGEISIMEYALNNSYLIADSSYIVKITGRLIVRNFDAIMKKLDNVRNFDICCDLRNNLAFSDSRIFVSSKIFLCEYLFPLKKLLNDSNGVWMEHILAFATHNALGDSMRWAPFHLALDIHGVSGTSGLILNTSRISFAIRYIFVKIKNYLLLR